MKALIFVCCAALVAGRTHERSGHHAADGVHSPEVRTRREMRLRMAELRMQHHPMEEEEHGHHEGHHNRHHKHGRFMNRHGRHHQGHGEQAVPQQLEDQQQEHHHHGDHHQHGHHWGHRVYYFYYRLMHGNSSDSYSMHGPRAVGSSSAFEEGSGDPHFDHAHHRAFKRAIHVAVFVVIALCVVGVVACIKRKMKMRRLMRATMMGTGGYVLVRKELILADDLPVIKVAGDLPNKDVL